MITIHDKTKKEKIIRILTLFRLIDNTSAWCFYILYTLKNMEKMTVIKEDNNNNNKMRAVGFDFQQC